MMVDLIICMVILPLQEAAPAAPGAGAMLEMSIPRDAIYTPGDVRIDLMVTQAARFVGPYCLRIIASVAGDVVHERRITLTRGKKASCELSFPEVRRVTQVRCRAELFIGEEVVEACEKPVRLWPRRCPCAVTQNGTEFWAFDPSGVIQKRLSESGVDAANAAFQAVRDFGTPSIVFVGEELDPRSVQTILDRIKMTDRNTVVVLLRRKQFPEGFQVSTTRDRDPCDSVVWERGSVLLKDLAARDLLGLLHGADAVHIKKRPGRSITSCLTGMSRDDNEVCSYLCVVQEENHVILYCQLSSTDHQDPRQMVLFHNLIQFACERIHSTTPHEATDTERVEP